MSDKRAIYVIGATLAAIVLVVGMVIAIPSTQSVTLNTAPLGIQGHAVIVLKDIDGNIKSYVQSDNVVVLNGQDCAADLLFGTTGGFLCDSGAEPEFFVNIHVGGSAASATDASLTQLIDPILTLQNTGVLIDQAAAGGDTGTLKTIKGTFTLTGAQTIAEVGLFDGTAIDDNLFSRIVLDTAISGDLDDTAAITYIVETGSGQP